MPLARLSNPRKAHTGPKPDGASQHHLLLLAIPPSDQIFQPEYDYVDATNEKDLVTQWASPKPTKLMETPSLSR
jgi:hypothetical protein